MNCPVCKNEPMLTLELSGIEIDHCLKCKGIWLDTGELELLLGNSAQTEEFLQNFQENKHSPEKAVKCPICGKKMEKVDAAENIVIDRCRKGHGIWFDQGELEEVIKAETQNSKVLELLKDMFGK